MLNKTFLIFFVISLISAGFITDFILGKDAPSWLSLVNNLMLVAVFFAMWVFSWRYKFEDKISGEHSLKSVTIEDEENVAIEPRDINIFNSIKDAKEAGWSFEEEVGKLGDEIVFSWASFENSKWKYAGIFDKENSKNKELVNNPLSNINFKLFGKFKYILHSTSEIKIDKEDSVEIKLEKPVPQTLIIEKT